MKRGSIIYAMVVAVLLAGAAPAHAGLVGLARGSGSFMGTLSDTTGMGGQAVTGRISFAAAPDEDWGVPGPNGLLRPSGTIRLTFGGERYVGWVTGGSVGQEADGRVARLWAKADQHAVGYEPWEGMFFLYALDAGDADSFVVTLPDGRSISGTMTSGGIVVQAR